MHRSPFATKPMHGVHAPPYRDKGGPLARFDAPPPNTGGPFGQSPQGPTGEEGCPCIPWWFVPLGVAGVVQAFAWLVSRR